MTIKNTLLLSYRIFVVLLLFGIFLIGPSALAFVPENPGPSGGSFGIESKLSGPAPTVGATITAPSNGQNFTEQPITVAGSCPKDLLVKLLVNDVFAGSQYCVDGTFNLQVSLFSGQNDIKALVYDNLDQEGPESNVVSVNFNNANFVAFGTLITLTSNFARRAAAPGATLTWPLQLSGGTGPYAFSINWGDGTQPQLMSQAVAGAVNISHVYKNSGVYQIVVKVTDANGVSAFLQLTAVATGQPTAGVTVDDNSNSASSTTKVKILLIPTIVALLIAIPAFWLGKRYELSELRKQIERDAEKYAGK